MGHYDWSGFHYGCTSRYVLTILIDQKIELLVLDRVFAVDVTADGRVLVSADKYGHVVATDLTTKTMLWSKHMDGRVHTLRIHNSVVFVPVTGQPVSVLDLMNGDVLRRYPVRSRETRGLAVISG